MSALKDLRREIQRKLIKLTSFASTDALHKLAAAIEDVVEEEVPGEDSTELELFDFIMDAMNSDQLRSLEDQGMSRLLFFNDLMSEQKQPQDEEEPVFEEATESVVVSVTTEKIIKPGTFKDMLNTKDKLTVPELKRFLRAHLRDKSSAELFQELSQAKQQDKENPQQFMYRLMGLKQRVMFAAKQSESEFQYDSKLVQGVFLHSLYQGLNEKYSYLRRDLKPHIANLSTSEEFILDLMTPVVSEEMERQIRLGQTQKNRTVTVRVVPIDDIIVHRDWLTDITM
ncbi:hypothetical protein N1851_029693 [Merluccius polli]|uniref:Uncharacterized protein n=1 Tax=Merluccius polli TaxID=89951 RepID=A0AA47M6W2_MERPO|nr:hypothetical protein N1851_029693 [Merluccius polli]